ncbi:hypothetical protein [Dactylosporangium sp. NPDC051541]
MVRLLMLAGLLAGLLGAGAAAFGGPDDGGAVNAVPLRMCPGGPPIIRD